MRARHVAVIRPGPGKPAVGGAEHPHAEQGVALRFADAVVGGPPALEAVGRPCTRFAGGNFFGGRQQGLEVERRERGHQQRTLGGFQHAGIAVVDLRVEHHARPAPGLSLVVRPHQLHAAEGTDVSLAAPGIDQEQLAALARATVGQPW